MCIAAETDAAPLTEQEVNLKLNELVGKAQTNTASRLDQLKWKPSVKGKVHIPLCRMMALPVVRPSLKNDVLTLSSHFTSCGYLEGNGYFYVALEDNHGKTRDVTKAISDQWSNEWKIRNEEFEQELLADDDLKVFSNKMFMVWDGNHRLQAWLPVIDQFHSGDLSWHFKVESIILDPKGEVALVLEALHEVNW